MLTEEQRLRAAALYCGADAQITGVAALRWHGLRYGPRVRTVQVLVPLATRRADAGFVTVTRTARRDTGSKLRPAMEICSVARAVADAALRGTDLREVRAFAAEAVQNRLATVGELLAELNAGPRRGSALFRRVLDELGAGVRSAPEAELREVFLSSAVLPQVRWNPRLVTAQGTRLPTPDGWIPEAALAFEVDSRAHHASPDAWQRTLARHNLLAAYGVLTLHFTPQQIRERPREVLLQAECAYLERIRARGAAVVGGFLP